MFESVSAVILLIVFLIPGYIWRMVEGHLVQQDKKSGWEIYALELLARSTVLYLPTLNFFYLQWKADWLEVHPWRSALVALLQIVVAPVLAGLISGIVRQQNFIPRVLAKCGLKAYNPIPSAWDVHFRDIKQCWVIVTLKTGGQVYGFFGPGSQASSDPKNRDIFISHSVVKGAQGFQLVENTEGVYISGSEILTIEFIHASS